MTINACPRRTAGSLALVAFLVLFLNHTWAAAPPLKEARLSNGITLHYVEFGNGPPVIFVHGSLSDYTYWEEQVETFSKHYHVIDYSRRYNYPNKNKAVPDYSAITDAEDLANLIQTLHLSPANVIGHSYGALAGLFLAARHPELLHRLVLAEPPAVSLLQHLPGAEAKTGKAMFADIQKRMVAPMRRKFTAGDRVAGLAIFMAYVFNDPNAWTKMSPTAQAETLRDAHEWDVMMTQGILFPPIAPETVRHIQVPVLLISGAKSYPFLRLIDEDLRELLPHEEHLLVPNADHQMWLQAPQLCAVTTERFLSARQPVHATTGAQR